MKTGKTRKDRREGVYLCAALLIAALLGVEAYMESRYGAHELARTSTDTAAVLRRMPSVEITEADRAFLSGVAGCPAVQSLLGEGEGGSVYAEEDAAVAAVAAGYLDEASAGSMIASVSFYEDGRTLYLWWKNEEERFFLQEKDAGNGSEYYKICIRDGLFHRTKMYENWDNQRAQSSVVRRRWLGWLWDRAWEE